MTNYFKSNFWATTYWEGDQYWRPKVPVPVPVVPVPAGGGGGGMWPLSRIECQNPELYAEFVKDRMEWICKPKKLDKSHEKLPKKNLSPEARLKWEIHNLKERIRDLQGEIKRLSNAVQSSESQKFVESRRQIKLLRDLLKKIKRVSRKFSDRPSILTEMIQKSINEARGTLQPEQQAPVIMTVLPAPTPQPTAVTALGEVQDRSYPAFMAAFPWALDSAVAAVCTYYLVPDKKKWLKVVGYSGAVALGGISLWRWFAESSKE